MRWKALLLTWKLRSTNWCIPECGYNYLAFTSWSFTYEFFNENLTQIHVTMPCPISAQSKCSIKTPCNPKKISWKLLTFVSLSPLKKKKPIFYLLLGIKDWTLFSLFWVYLRCWFSKHLISVYSLRFQTEVKGVQKGIRLWN